MLVLREVEEINAVFSAFPFLIKKFLAHKNWLNHFHVFNQCKKLCSQADKGYRLPNYFRELYTNAALSSTHLHSKMKHQFPQYNHPTNPVFLFYKLIATTKIGQKKARRCGGNDGHQPCYKVTQMRGKGF